VQLCFARRGSIYEPDGRRRIAEEIRRQFEIYHPRNEPDPFLSADHLERTLQDIASGEYRDRLSPIFGAPCHVFSVALIWPRDSQDEIVEGELHCRKYQWTSWTKIVLPEVLFLPNMMIGKGGGNLFDTWYIDQGLPVHTFCPTHRNAGLFTPRINFFP